MKHHQLILLLICLLYFTSCGYTIYTPTTKGSHTVHEKKQVLTSGGLGASANHLVLDMNASYSPIDHLGTQINYNWDENYQNIGFAVGYYFAKYKYSNELKTGFHIDSYLGYSFIEASDWVSSFFFNAYEYKINYQDLYLTTGLHAYWKRIGIDIIYRPHFIDVKSYELSKYSPRDVDTEFENLAKDNFIFSDITGKISIGEGGFEVYAASNFTLARANIRPPSFDRFSINGGIHINISQLYHSIKSIYKK